MRTSCQRYAAFQSGHGTGMPRFCAVVSRTARMWICYDSLSWLSLGGARIDLVARGTRGTSSTKVIWTHTSQCHGYLRSRLLLLQSSAALMLLLRLLLRDGDCLFFIFTPFLLSVGQVPVRSRSVAKPHGGQTGWGPAATCRSAKEWSATAPLTAGCRAHQSDRDQRRFSIPCMGLDAVGTYTLICTAVEEVIGGRPYAASSPPRTIALTVVCTEPLLTQKYAGACSAAGMSLHERPNWLKRAGMRLQKAACSFCVSLPGVSLLS